MPHRIIKLRAVLLLAGVGLAFVQLPVQAMHDLDLYEDARLQEDLDDELDDILVSQGGQMEPDEEVSIDDLRAAILGALSDRGDEGLENEIDRADLDMEMKEANTTVEAVLDEALAEADLIASESDTSSWAFTQVNSQNDSLWYAQSRNQRSTPRAVIPTFTSKLINKILSAP
jgi:hypothetical protein